MSDYPNLQALARASVALAALPTWRAIREEAKAALAIIARLPKTADDVPVIVHEHPVVFVFTKRKGLYRPGEKADWWEMVVDMFDGECFSGVVAGSHRAAFRSGYCYSTYKAAMMATAAKVAETAEPEGV